MTNEVSGIAALLQDTKFTIGDLINHGNLVAEMQKTESASRAGKANSDKLSRLRDLALEVYADECEKLLKNNPEAQKLFDSHPPREGLMKMIRPSLKVYYIAFLDAANGSNKTWNSFEKGSIERIRLSDLENSALRGWWRKLSNELDDFFKKV